MHLAQSSWSILNNKENHHAWAGAPALQQGDPRGPQKAIFTISFPRTKPLKQSKAEGKCLLRHQAKRWLPGAPGAMWVLLEVAGGTGQGITHRWEALLHSCAPKCSLERANLARAALPSASAQQGQVCPSWERSVGQEGRAAPTTLPTTGWTFPNGRLCSQPGPLFLYIVSLIEAQKPFV